MLLIGYKNYENREGKIHIASEDSAELLVRVPYLSFLGENIQSCKWYEQIASKSGIIFIFTDGYINGEIVLENNLFDDIITNYNWSDFSYEELASVHGSAVVNPMYKTSMIKDILKTKNLLICSDREFQSSGFGYYTFIDKESQKLYFYYNY